MPNEVDTTLAKRKAVQSVMQDRSLSALERNKKIQDVMAGKVVLPRVVATKEPASKASRCQSHGEKRNAESPDRKEYSRRNDIDRADSRKGVYSSNINDANEAETQGSERVDSDINDSQADAGAGANAARKDAPNNSPNAMASHRAKRNLIKGDSSGVRGIAMGNARLLNARLTSNGGHMDRSCQSMEAVYDCHPSLISQ
jgi:hypothetical protein